MRRVIRFLDDLVDLALALILILALLIGIYFICDTAYVYRHAAAPAAGYFRPDGKHAGTAADERPFTDGFAAWLLIDDSSIRYPVMQAEDNSRFLNTDPYGDYSLTGSVFLDCRNAGDFSDAYSLIYGHHMSGDYMFGALDRFYDKSYFEQHRTGTLHVGGLIYPLQIFALLSADAADRTVFVPGNAADVLILAAENAVFYREPASGHLLALTTCVDTADTARTVVLCALGEPYQEGESK